MKKTIIAAIAVALTFASCAKEKKFTRSNGTQFAAKPYGWATKEDKIEGVEYEVSTPNLILRLSFRKQSQLRWLLQQPNYGSQLAIQNLKQRSNEKDNVQRLVRLNTSRT